MFRERNRLILERGLQLVQSVDYAVSLRWVFYGLLQEGFYSDKDGYASWKDISARARKKFYGGWSPRTLADDTRQILHRTGRYRDHKEARKDLPDRIADSVNVWFDHFYNQENYVELWFEAGAMVGQFDYYTQNVTLVPFRGDASIPHKWNMAKNLEKASARYEKPIVVLYFGDLDEKGQEIPGNALRDIQSWCDVDFELFWCGLTAEQAKAKEVPPSPFKPGEYQWEALTDEAAQEIIEESLEMAQIDLKLIEDCRGWSVTETHLWRDKVRKALKGSEVGSE